MTEISRYHLAVARRRKKTVCLVSPVTSTRALSKRENLDNCEPRGEGLASRLPARTRIIVVLWWAPDTSLLSLRESLPLDSLSLSLSRPTLSSRFTVSARFTRNFAHHALANREITIYDYDSTIVIARLLVFINFIDRRKGIRDSFSWHETYSIFFILISIFEDHRGISSLAIRVVVVHRFPGGDPEIFSFTLISKRNVPFMEKRRFSFPLERRRKKKFLLWNSK